MKNAAAILFIISFFAQSFNQLAIVLEFYANRSQYSRVCENKARPMLHCNGKCQLAKKLSQQEKKDERGPERKPLSKSKLTFFCDENENAGSVMTSPAKQFTYSENSITGFSPAIFHPPTNA